MKKALTYSIIIILSAIIIAFALSSLIKLFIYPAVTADTIEGTVLRQESRLTADGFQYEIELLVEDKIGNSYVARIGIEEDAFAPYPPGCRAIINLKDPDYTLLGGR